MTLYQIKEAIKTSVRAFVFWWPFGALCVFEEKGETITVHKNFWVTISDGTCRDALPLSFCSQGLVDRVEAELASRWYAPASA